jgi:hypothetical protein
VAPARPTPRDVARHFAPGVALIVVGLIVLGASGGHTGWVAAAVLIAGIGGVLVVSAAFYEIGRSEDRDREADQRRGR